MTAREHLTALVAGIRQDLEHCRQLGDLLTRQQRMLAEQDADGLTEIGSVITRHLEALDNQAQIRSRTLQSLGLPFDASGMRMLIDKLPKTTGVQLQNLWQELREALAACQSLNERNGQLLAAHRQVVGQITGQTVSPYEEYR